MFDLIWKIIFDIKPNLPEWNKLSYAVYNMLFKYFFNLSLHSATNSYIIY